MLDNDVIEASPFSDEYAARVKELLTILKPMMTDKVNEETRQRVLQTAYLVPTGDFGDSPGNKKVFRRKIVLP